MQLSRAPSHNAIDISARTPIHSCCMRRLARLSAAVLCYSSACSVGPYVRAPASKVPHRSAFDISFRGRSLTSMESARKRMRVAADNITQDARATEPDLMDIYNTLDTVGNGDHANKQQTNGQAGAAAAGQAAPAAPAQVAGPASAQQTSTQQQQVQQQKGGGRQHQLKKQKKQDPAREVASRLHAACKQQLSREVLSIYEQAVADGISLQQHVYNTVLYQAACGDTWEKLARRQFGQQVQLADDAMSADDVAYVTSKAGSIVDAIQAHGWKLDEVGYTAMARVALLQGRPGEAMQWALRAKEAGQPVRLRSYHPALVGFAHDGDAEQAMQVLCIYQGAGIDLTEQELRYMLEAVARGGSYQHWRQLAELLTDNLNALEPATVAHIKDFFSSSRAAEAAGAAVQQAGEEAAARQQQEAQHGRAAEPARGEQQQEEAQQQASSSGSGSSGTYSGWQLLPAEVSSDGSCEAASGKLRVVELADSEWDTFASSIAALAASKEARKDEFKRFMDWYDKHGPYDVLIDGANVALFGQNMDGGGFRTEQIREVVKQVHEDMPGAKVLLILHVRRLKEDNITGVPANAAFIEEMKEAKAFTFTPPGSNDDWYWLYATVRAKTRGLLVSNDLLRDHIFQLLRPKHFIKWSERHIVRYSFTPDVSLALQYPAPYTACVQQLANGAWMVPCTDGTWLCAKPQQGEA